MKYLNIKLIFLFLLCSSTIYGQQVPLADLIQLKQKEFDDFESIVLKSKFIFQNYKTDSSSERAYYVYPPTQAVIVWNKLWNKTHYIYLITIDYLFSGINKYLSFKQELKNLGYKFQENKNQNGQMCNVYTRIKQIKNSPYNFSVITVCQQLFQGRVVYTISI